MTLAEEIAADMESDEIVADLFSDCKWNGHPVKAMIEPTAIVEGMDSLGGPMLTGERQFKFRRSDLRKISANLGMIGDVITYSGKSYDVTELDERPNHPVIIVKTELRPE